MTTQHTVKIRALAKKYNLGRYKQDVEDYAVAQLNGRRPLDQQFLFELFQHHPDWEHKARKGVVRFLVDKSPHHSTNCFYILHQDGTRTEISLGWTISPGTHRDDVLLAMRHALKLHRDLVKSEAVGKPCLYCSCTLTSYDTHVHHCLPNTFIILAERFVREETSGWMETEIIGARVYKFADPVLSCKWVVFHAEHATLQAMCKYCHNSRKFDI